MQLGTKKQRYDENVQAKATIQIYYIASADLVCVFGFKEYSDVENMRKAEEYIA